MPEHPTIPTQLSEEQITDQFIYSGSSMQPTFKPGQMLYVRPLLEDIDVGDVIVFADKTKTSYVVHRVIKIEQQKFYTRGDNNPFDDVDPVLPEQVLGVVKWADSNGAIKAIRGGRAGFQQQQRQKLRKKITQIILRLFFPLYHLLRISRIVPKIWHPHIRTLRVCAGDGFLIKYLHRSQVVALWDSETEQFTCQHPYDLVIKPPGKR